MTRFDEAWEWANRWTASHLQQVSGQVVVVRDLFGRIRIALDDRSHPIEVAEEALASLRQQLGNFATSDLLLRGSDNPMADYIFTHPDLRTQQGWRVLERQVVDADWQRPPFAEAKSRRLTFFGVKGGVGRSTAIVSLCQHLAQRGRKVLVVDLDLESPGVGTTLLTEDRRPTFGVVDWFVEQAVAQADRDLVSAMTSLSPLGENQDGEIRVASASGVSFETYLAKLSRVYLDLPGQGPLAQEFGQRLQTMLCQLEDCYSPDVTLLDCRSGIHDISAVALSRLGAINLLFAIDTRQTWDSYRMLLQPWRQARHLKNRLKLVASLIPETGTSAYLDSFVANAHGLFSDCLYEEADEGDTESFNFDPQHEEAPHFPLKIHWSRSLQQYDPIRDPQAVTPQQWKSGFGEFVESVEALVFVP